MWDAPKSKAEYYRRAVRMPWIIAGITCVVATGAIVFFLFIKDPPVRQGGRTKSDTRQAMAATAGVIGLGFLIRAPIATNRWRILSSRGVETGATAVNVSQIGKSGSRPVRVSYVVDGKAYTIAFDEPDMFAEEMEADPDGTRVLYDPQRPSHAVALSPKIARLPPA